MIEKDMIECKLHKSNQVILSFRRSFTCHSSAQTVDLRFTEISAPIHPLGAECTLPLTMQRRHGLKVITNELANRKIF